MIDLTTLIPFRPDWCLGLVLADYSDPAHVAVVLRTIRSLPEEDITLLRKINAQLAVPQGVGLN